MKPAISTALPLTEAVDWLLRSGVNAPTPGAMLGELCRRLVKETLPIASATLSIASLDPLISATQLSWQPDSGRVIEQVMLHGMAARVESAETAAVGFAFPGTSHRIEWRSGRAEG